jgi:hypothetical protein
MYLSHYDYGTSSNYALKQSPTGSTSVNAPSSQTVGLSINNSTKLLVSSAGSVGIGTTSPVATLDVNGNNITTGTATFIDQNKGGNKSHIHYGSSGDWYIRSSTNAGKILIQDTGGNVGIGTTSPATKLDVNGNIQITGVGNTLIFDNSSVKWQQYVNGNEFTLRYNGGAWSERLRIDTDGNLGVGTTNPTEKLDVNGTVKSTGLYVTSAPRIDAGGGSQPGPIPNQSPSDAIVRSGGDTAIYLSEPDEWLVVNISGVDYVIPAYL